MNDGTPVIRYDPSMSQANGNNAPGTCDTDVAAIDCDNGQLDTTTAGSGPSGFCGLAQLRSQTLGNGVACTTPLLQTDNHWAVQLAAYKAVPDYLWQVVVQYGMATPDQLGEFP